MEERYGRTIEITEDHYFPDSSEVPRKCMQIQAKRIGRYLSTGNAISEISKVNEGIEDITQEARGTSQDKGEWSFVRPKGSLEGFHRRRFRQVQEIGRASGRERG